MMAPTSAAGMVSRLRAQPAGRLGKRLNAMGIFTIDDMRDADPVLIRKKCNVVVQRTVRELRGTPASNWNRPGG